MINMSKTYARESHDPSYELPFLERRRVPEPLRAFSHRSRMLAGRVHEKLCGQKNESEKPFIGTPISESMQIHHQYIDRLKKKKRAKRIAKEGLAVTGIAAAILGASSLN